jgi:hypothetical protein
MAPFSNFDLRKPSINTVANSLKYIYYILNSKSYIVVIVLSPLIGFVRVFPLGARYEVRYCLPLQYSHQFTPVRFHKNVDKVLINFWLDKYELH